MTSSAACASSRAKASSARRSDAVASEASNETSPTGKRRRLGRGGYSAMYYISTVTKSHQVKQGDVRIFDAE